MKNFIISLVLIAIAAFALQMFLPWWSIAIAGFAAGLIVKQKSGMAFLAGFIAVFVLWVIYAYMLSSANNNILASKVAVLLPLKGHVKLLLLVTGLIGGLVAGFATLSGRLAAQLK